MNERVTEYAVSPWRLKTGTFTIEKQHKDRSKRRARETRAHFEDDFRLSDRSTGDYQYYSIGFAGPILLVYDIFNPDVPQVVAGTLKFNPDVP